MALLIILGKKADQELEVQIHVHVATYGPEIDQSQHMKCVSCVIILVLPRGGDIWLLCIHE